MSTKPAFDDILARAQSGDAKAQYVVAAVLARAGRTEEADRWLNSAARLGEPEAQYTLATRKMRTRAGCAEAAPLLQRAAQGGSAAAERLLAGLEQDGVGAPRDEARARARITGLARAGDPAAMRDLAGLLILRDPDDRDAGALLARAALQDAVAAYVLGARVAAGRPDTDGTRAAASLETFARGGFALAEQMRATIEPRLAGGAPLASPDFGRPDFDAVERKLAAEPAPLAPPRALLASPRAALFERAAPAELCAYVQAAAFPFLAPSTIEAPDGKTQRHPTRTSFTATLGPVDLDLTLIAFNLRLAAAADVDALQGEFLSVLRYRPGEEYRPHYDWLPDGPERRRGGQRIVTALCCLNDDYEGGDTRFLRAGVDVKGGTGDILVFWNVDLAGAPDPASYHAGAPVRAGEKWLASKWFREGPYIF